jgi:hypothetical protein
MGQLVMMQMQLTWLGEHGPLIQTKNAFKVVLVIFFSYFVYSLALEFAVTQYMTIDAVPGYIPALKLAGGSIFFSDWWALFSLCRNGERAFALAVPSKRPDVQDARICAAPFGVAVSRSRSLPVTLVNMRLTKPHAAHRQDILLELLFVIRGDYEGAVSSATSGQGFVCFKIGSRLHLGVL